MTIFLVLWAGLTFIVARALVMAMPAFAAAIDSHLFSNIIVGTSSDLAMISILAFIYFSVDKVIARSRSWKGILRLVMTAFTLVLIASLYMHLRYIEQYGMTIRPSYLFSLQTEDFLSASIDITFSSWRFQVVLLVPFVLAILCAKLMPKVMASLGKFPLAYVAAAILCNSVNINMRNRLGVHKELRYNPFSAFYFNVKEYRDAVNFRLPEAKILAQAKDEFMPGHTWSDDPRYVQYPLWQKQLFLAAGANISGLMIRNDFVSYLREEEKDKGPWNVVIVMMGSVRSLEIGYLNPELPKSSSPGIDAILAEGISFTEAIADGSNSKHGQIAAACSLYSFPNFPLMVTAPTTNASCLSDILGARGYDTYLFDAGDANFDNQRIFYQHHKTKHLITKEDFPAQTSRGFWGYSDHALYGKALAELRKSRQPFYATILSLANRLPFQVPSDAPVEINQGQVSRGQVHSYTDWSFSAFYRDFMQEFPHTIMVVVGDRGVPEGDQLEADNLQYEGLRKLFRVPFTILAGNMPTKLRGTKLSTIVSNADVAPTLLSLLGYADTAQQFMGIDAFSRTDQEIYANWFETFMRVSIKSSKPLVEKVSEFHENTMSIIGQYNLYAP